jgi:low affinity Fe/Cu permease
MKNCSLEVKVNMTESKDSNPTENNIFRIADELVHQVDRTKKMVLIMIFAVIIAVPTTWHLAPLVKGVSFQAVGYVAIATAIVFIVVAVRQWMVLSKWTRKYKAYKEMQKKVDEKLDFDSENT